MRLAFSTWRGYLTANRSDTEARLLLAIGGRYPYAVRREIEKQHKEGRLNDEERDFRLSILAVWRERWSETTAGAAGDHNPREWRYLGNGGWQKRAIYSSNN
jgi:hypothetical protein